jgi:hypothetical protein
MKKIVLIGLVLSLMFQVGLAKDNPYKLKGQITIIDHTAMVLEVAQMRFFIDTKTKLEDINSVHINFDKFQVGTWIELEYQPAQTHPEGFIYASKIEIWQ